MEERGEAHRPDGEGYRAFLAELAEAERRNVEAFERALLSLSSVLLALSLTFIDEIVALVTARYAALLFTGWVALIGTIITTVVGSMYAQLAVPRLIKKGEEFFLKGEFDHDRYSVRVSNTIRGFNVLSGVLFVVGILALAIFIMTNLDFGGSANG